MSAHIVSARIMLAHIVALLVSLVAGLRAGQSRMRLCRRLARHGLAAID
jgi:RNase P/RNase MRP subunit p30